MNISVSPVEKKKTSQWGQSGDQINCQKCILKPKGTRAQTNQKSNG